MSVLSGQERKRKRKQRKTKAALLQHTTYSRRHTRRGGNDTDHKQQAASSGSTQPTSTMVAPQQQLLRASPAAAQHPRLLQCTGHQLAAVKPLLLSHGGCCLHCRPQPALCEVHNLSGRGKRATYAPPNLVCAAHTVPQSTHTAPSAHTAPTPHPLHTASTCNIRLVPSSALAPP